MVRPSDFTSWQAWARYVWREWNPLELGRKVVWFLRRVWVYRVALWHDLDGDYAPLLGLMEVKLRRMGRHFATHRRVMDWETMARECLTAAELCRRIAEGDSRTGDPEKAIERRHTDLLYLTHLMRRKLLCWWD